VDKGVEISPYNRPDQSIASSNSITIELFGYRFQVMDISKLNIAKRAAGRPKDLIALPELEAIQQAQTLTDKKE
jgi:hypothetical protein